MAPQLKTIFITIYSTTSSIMCLALGISFERMKDKEYLLN